MQICYCRGLRKTCFVWGFVGLLYELKGGELYGESSPSVCLSVRLSDCPTVRLSDFLLPDLGY